MKKEDSIWNYETQRLMKRITGSSEVLRGKGGSRLKILKSCLPGRISGTNKKGKKSK